MAEKKGGRLSAFIVGALAGAIGGLLYAPRAGKETREEVRRRAEEFVEQGRESYAEQSDWMRKMASDQAEQLRTRIETTRERLKSSIEAAGDAAQEGLRVATGMSEQVIERAADAATAATQVVSEGSPVELEPKNAKSHSGEAEEGENVSE
ncbi:MAG: YtxH domain-containing protein [Chloroflexi bacterium]|nr:YtxH domain-containing protein [Chloroflexota bacterium]